MCREVALRIASRTAGESAGHVLALATSAAGPRHPPRRHQHLARGARERLAGDGFSDLQIDGVLAALPIVTLEPSVRTTSSPSGSALFGELRPQSHGGCDSLQLSSGAGGLGHGSRDARPRQIAASSSAAAIVAVTSAPLPSGAHAR
jgi:hypothetical protein